jgi:hypothetical protein
MVLLNQPGPGWGLGGEREYARDAATMATDQVICASSDIGDGPRGAPGFPGAMLPVADDRFLGVRAGNGTAHNITMPYFY